MKAEFGSATVEVGWSNQHLQCKGLMNPATVYNYYMLANFRWEDQILRGRYYLIYTGWDNHRFTRRFFLFMKNTSLKYVPELWFLKDVWYFISPYAFQCWFEDLLYRRPLDLFFLFLECMYIEKDNCKRISIYSSLLFVKSHFGNKKKSLTENNSVWYSE